MLLHQLAIIVASLIFLQVGVSASTSQPPTSAEEEVLKVSRAWLDARNHRDLGTFAAFMSDDFIGSTDIGERTTKEWLVDWLSKRRPEDEQKVDLRDVQVHLEGDTAIVNYLITVRKGWGKTVVINNRRRTEVFKKTSEKWLAIAAHESDLPANYFKPVEIDPKILKDYVGHYDWPRHRIDDRDTFTVEDGRLFSEWRGVKRKCLAKGKDTFFQRDDSGWWTFVRDRQGHVTGYIYFYPDGQEVPVTRID
jgi:ketosteroid isomerase-like protein